MRGYVGLFGMMMLVAAPLAGWGRPIEERLRLQHVRPTEVAERIDLLTGAALGLESPHLRVIPDDATGTLVVRIGDAAGGDLEQQRMRLMLRDYIATIDQPEEPFSVSLYVVRPGSMTAEEFSALDAALRRAPMEIPPGANAKGVIFWTEIELEDQQVGLLAEERPPGREGGALGPLRVTGRLMPYEALRGGEAVGLQVELAVEAERAPLAGGRNRVELRGRTAEANRQPLVIVAGRQQSPETTTRNAPPQHELMIYLWAVEKKPDAAARK